MCVYKKTLPALKVLFFLCGIFGVPLISGCSVQGVPLISGRSVQNIRLQAAPYTNNLGRYRIPAGHSLDIDMYPNDKIPVLWCDLQIMVIRFVEEKKNIHWLFDLHEYVFSIEPAEDLFQKERRTELGFEGTLAFAPETFTLRQNHPGTTSVKGVATRIKMKTDDSGTVKGGTRLKVLEVDFDQALYERLLDTFGPPERTPEGYKIAWRRKKILTGEKIEVKKIEYRIAEIKLEANETGLKDHIVISVYQTTWARKSKEVEILHFEEIWPMRLSALDQQPIKVKVVPSRDVEFSDSFADPSKPAENTRVEYVIPALREYPIASGTLNVINGEAILDLQQFADMAVNEPEVVVEFTVGNDKNTLRVSRSAFVDIMRSR